MKLSESRYICKCWISWIGCKLPGLRRKTHACSFLFLFVQWISEINPIHVCILKNHFVFVGVKCLIKNLVLGTQIGWFHNAMFCMQVLILTSRECKVLSSWSQEMHDITFQYAVIHSLLLIVMIGFFYCQFKRELNDEGKVTFWKTKWNSWIKEELNFTICNGIPVFVCFVLSSICTVDATVLSDIFH